MSDNNKTPKITVTLEPTGYHLECNSGTSLLTCAQMVGVEINAVCAGNGTCGMCKVFVVSGDVSPLSDLEREHLSLDEMNKNLRLACQVNALSDCLVQFPPESLATMQRLQLEGQELHVKIDNDYLFQPGAYGFAVDIGTTKLAGYLLDMQNGRTLAMGGVTNPQIAFGEDVISRIQYTDNHEHGLDTLHRILVDVLDKLLADLCVEAGISPSHVVEGVMVGNTAMHHFLAGIPVHSLGVAPYQPGQLASMYLPASGIGLHMAEDACVYLPPNIAGFVGGDHVAMLLATGAPSLPQTVIALDIGTNTEISLIHQGRHWACSCASGPAFEGAHIHEGMRAIPGAIERFKLENDKHQLLTIERKPAIGICGSGILDVVAELRRAGILDRRGTFTANDPRVNRENGNTRFVLVPSTDTGHGREISINRSDVNEIQLAKAAIRSGIEMLLKTAGITYEMIELFLVAGAFGTYLDVGNAVGIGMFPRISLECYRQVGNAAGVGAKQMLLSKSHRALAERLGDHIQYVELAGTREYPGIFMHGIALE